MSGTLVSPEDFIGIFNLMGTYQHLVDEGDEDAWADLFTGDGEFLGLPGAPPDAFRGREGLKQIPRASAPIGGRHLMGSFSAQYGDSKDEAHARYYVLFVTCKDEPKMNMLALVRTHLVRVDGDSETVRIWVDSSETGD